MHLYLSQDADDARERIEQFLLRQIGVAHVRVWQRSSQILASVTVTEDSTLGEYDLRQACAKEVGRVPDMMMVQRALRPAA